jgi:peroxiredoxin Q/BCP
MTHLKEGDSAPAFKGEDQDGNEVKLEDYSGKKLILFFYPKDNTPGCTAEACSLRDHYQELYDKGFELLGVSADSARKHQNFIKKYSLPFPLLVDTEKETIEAFGVWGPKKFMGRTFDGIHRTTFVIDEAGKVEKIFTKVKTKTHARQILDEMAEVG